MRQGWIAAALLLAASPAFAQDAATLSFATNHAGSHPQSIRGDETITVNLSALAPDTAVHRAILRPGRIEGEANRQRDVPIRVTLKDREEPLKLLGPRFTAFDVT